MLIGFLTSLIGALFNLRGPGEYFHWGVVQVSWANLVVIVLLFVVFITALFVPFPSHHNRKKS